MVSESVNTLKTRVRGGARQVALDTLSVWHSIGGKDREAFQQPRVYFPYLHDVPKHEEGAFRAFVEMLAQNHTFLSYGDAIERVLGGPIDKPYVAFSFDDGFASNVAASRILEEYGATGCFFVPPGFIDSKLSTAAAMKEFGFAEGTCEDAMTWSDLENLKSRGHEIGNHTLNHRTLSTISEHQAVDEISLGADRIREILGECRHFAWPRGRFKHMTELAVRTVFDAGHDSCASAERGAHVRPVDDDAGLLCVRRDHIMTSWPLRHSKYFVGKAARTVTGQSNEWPEDWRVTS